MKNNSYSWVPTEILGRQFHHTHGRSGVDATVNLTHLIWYCSIKKQSEWQIEIVEKKITFLKFIFNARTVILKVSKSRKWFMMSLILPKNKRKNSTVLLWLLWPNCFLLVFWENWGNHKLLSIVTDLYIIPLHKVFKQIILYFCY